MAFGNGEFDIDSSDQDSLDIITDLASIREKLVQPSDPVSRVVSLAFSNVAGDKDFPNIVFPADFVPTNATIKRARLGIRYRDRRDTSAAINRINAAGKTIRVKLSTGAWGTNDIVAITMALNDWYTAAAGVESGGLIMGSVDIKSIISTPAIINGATLNVRSEQTNRGEGITVTGASLTLYGVDSYAYVEYSL